MKRHLQLQFPTRSLSFSLVLSITVLCSSAIQGFAQDTKKISQTKKGEGFKISESYSVLKSDPALKHGPYTASISGYRETGNYDNGQRVGIWESYWKGELRYKYDFSNRKFLQQEAPLLITKITQIDEQGNALKELPLQNLYMGGNNKMLSIMVAAVRYPVKAMEYNVQGAVLISATLTAAAEIKDIQLESKLGYGLEEEALRVFKLLPQEDWLPVYLDGKAVPVRFQYQFKFSLN
ncbi:energy transducer TonB [Pedobacter sp. GR22-6]|uniref:energy transducer TonB n=1 Tax=Pedobacter sp. GR22-6 TaxID=3127957 RepID=UPI00307F0C22